MSPLKTRRTQIPEAEKEQQGRHIGQAPNPRPNTYTLQQEVWPSLTSPLRPPLQTTTTAEMLEASGFQTFFSSRIPDPNIENKDKRQDVLGEADSKIN